MKVQFFLDKIMQLIHVSVVADGEAVKKKTPNVKQVERGSTFFIRWGRNDCPQNITQLVYSGICLS